MSRIFFWELNLVLTLFCHFYPFPALIKLGLHRLYIMNTLRVSDGIGFSNLSQSQKFDAFSVRQQSWIKISWWHKVMSWLIKNKALSWVLKFIKNTDFWCKALQWNRVLKFVTSTDFWCKASQWAFDVKYRSVDLFLSVKFIINLFLPPLLINLFLSLLPINLFLSLLPINLFCHFYPFPALIKPGLHRLYMTNAWSA